MSKSRKSGAKIPKLPKGPAVETRGRDTISKDGATRHEKITVLVTPAEKAAFLAQAGGPGRKLQALARRALHAECPAIATT